MKAKNGGVILTSKKFAISLGAEDYEILPRGEIQKE